MPHGPYFVYDQYGKCIRLLDSERIAPVVIMYDAEGNRLRPETGAAADDPTIVPKPDTEKNEGQE